MAFQAGTEVNVRTVRLHWHMVGCAILLHAGGACNDPDEPATSRLQVTVTTTGHNADPDGYGLIVDGDTGTTLPASGTAAVDGIRVGEHLVSLADVADNCTVDGDVPAHVTIADGTPASVTFLVRCTFANTLAFVQNGDLYATTPDPNAEPRLLAAGLVGPNWSPNGDLLLALRTGDAPALFLMDAEGGGLHQLTGVDYHGYDVTVGTWKPDGQTIAFDVERQCCFPNAQVMRIDVDGSNESSFLPDLYFDPKWSPDGTRLTLQELAGAVALVNDDGTGVHSLIAGSGAEWSPEGDDIAVTGLDGATIQLIGPDSTDLRTLDPVAIGSASRPKWSPDGSKIAYRAIQPGMFPGYVPAVVNADGSGRVVLAPSLHMIDFVDWSFDGEHLAFVAYASQADSAAGQSRVYVVRVDGSDLHPVSPPGSVCCFDWRP
jgi:hypothetical protein